MNDGGQLIGTWAADGRYIDPQSLPSVFDATSPTHTLDLFLGGSPNGEWTLFLADLNGEYQSTLLSWGMQIQTVPEPSSGQMFMVCGMSGVVILFLRRRRAQING